MRKNKHPKSYSSPKFQCGNEGYLQYSKVRQDSEILFFNSNIFFGFIYLTYYHIIISYDRVAHCSNFILWWSIAMGDRGYLLSLFSQDRVARTWEPVRLL